MSKLFRALLIIDAQDDFCKAPVTERVERGVMGDEEVVVESGGSLYVTGADEDMKRLSKFIKAKLEGIDDMFLTFDDHKRMDIAHPMWWVDENGNQPKPLTVITLDDVQSGKWSTRLPEMQEWSEFYIKKLKDQGKFPHVIWPYHCIANTKGAALVSVLEEALAEWEEVNTKSPIVIRKGQFPLTEHYSAVKAEVVVDGEPDTDVNTEMIDELKKYDQILVAGEALSHCVGNTVRDMVANGIDPKKVIVLSDCTSNVPTFEAQGEAFVSEMKDLGMRFMTTEEFND